MHLPDFFNSLPLLTLAQGSLSLASRAEVKAVGRGGVRGTHVAGPNVVPYRAQQRYRHRVCISAARTYVPQAIAEATLGKGRRTAGAGHT